jgi:hypothetical protein
MLYHPRTSQRFLYHHTCRLVAPEGRFLSARKADLKKGFQHLVVLVVVLVLVLVVGTRVKKGF